MGAFECESISSFRISLEQIGKLFQRTINVKEIPNQEKPFSLRYNLIEEYNKIKLKSKNISEIFIYSKKCRCISDFTTLEQEKEIFIKWVKVLYDFNNIKDFNENKIQKITSDKIFFKNLEKAYITNKKPFLKLVALGVPQNLRQFIWTMIIDKDEKDISNVSNYEKEKEYFQTLLSINNNNKNDLEQINKDISRTFTDSSNTQKNISILKQILIALTNLNEKIGYCQGINFIVGLILKITKFNEIKSFHLSRLILKKIKAYFTKEFPLLKYNLKKFNEAFIKLFPKLFHHFKDNDIVNEIWVGKWIQTLFTVNLPFNELCHIWDALLVYGMDFIIPIILSILYFMKDKLLELKDSSDIMIFLQETLYPTQENLVNIIYKEDINLKGYIIPLKDILSNAKKIRNQLNLGPNDGNEYNLRNRLDIRDSSTLRNSTISSGNFEIKMERIKAKKLSEKRNSHKLVINKNNNNAKQPNNIHVNKFFTTYHRNKKEEQNNKYMKNINNDIINSKNRCQSQEFNNNSYYLNNSKINNNKKFYLNYCNENQDRAHSDNKYFKNYSLNNNKGYNGYSNLSKAQNSNNFQNLYQLFNNLNYLYGCNTQKINILNNVKHNLFNNSFGNNNNILNMNNNNNIYNNQITSNKPIVNININYYPVYNYNIINNASNKNFIRKEIRTPEINGINRIKLKQKIFNQIDNRRNNLNEDFFSNNINEFIEGEKNKNVIHKFNNIRIINQNFS